MSHKSFSTVLHDCWNSYNDIAVQIGMKRESVVQIIGELVNIGLVVRMRRRSRENRRVYVDNHYAIVRFETGHIRGRMPVQATVPAMDSCGSGNERARLAPLPDFHFVRGSP